MFRRLTSPPSSGLKSKASEKLSDAGRNNSAHRPLLLFSCFDYSCEEFEVLTAVVMKSPSIWGIMPCNPLKINRRFGGNVASIFSVEE
jgi:hypothetical protein